MNLQTQKLLQRFEYVVESQKTSHMHFDYNFVDRGEYRVIDGSHDGFNEPSWIHEGPTGPKPRPTRFVITEITVMVGSLRVGDHG